MGKYSTKKTDSEGVETWIASDGKTYKTRAGAWKHSKDLLESLAYDEDSAAGESSEAEVTISTESEPTVEPTPTTIEEDDSWATFDIESSGEIASETIPTFFKKISPAGAPGKGGKKTKAQIRVERETNLAVLRIFYRTSDHLMTKYRRVMLDDPKADPISHTEGDYTWISGTTNAALEHQGFNIGSAIGPTQIAVIANVYYFGSPLARIHAESKKSPFTGKGGSAVRRFLERLPIIGPRLKKKNNATPVPDFMQNTQTNSQNEG